MELGVEYIYVFARSGIQGALEKIGKRVKVLSVIPQQVTGEYNVPVILLYDLENKKIIGLGPNDDSITVGIFTILAMANGIASLSGGKVISVNIPDEFLENPLQFSRQRTAGAFM
ncbi:MAG: hypothetical protein QXV69_06465 [Sulfolobaceae archaeon]